MIQGIWVFVISGAILLAGVVVLLLMKNKLLANAKKEASLLKEKIIAEEKEKIKKLEQEKLEQLRQQEKALEQKKFDIQKKENAIEEKEKRLLEREKTLQEKLSELNQKSKVLKVREEELSKKINEQKSLLEKISQLSSEEAKKMLISAMEEEARKDAQRLISDILKRAEEDAQRKARRILATVIQRTSTENIVPLTTTTVKIGSDDLKGRIIGREGRNIKAFEAATGVELIVDDTPGEVMLSSFDGVKRFIAKLTLEKLLEDGRIHPARIEEIAAKVKEDVGKHLKEIGIDAAQKIGISNLPEKIINLLGRMQFRSSYTQNMMEHSLEVAKIAKSLAWELGANPEISARAGLLHDIGKAVSEEVEGSHARVGADIARKCGEKDIVVNAIEAHHEEVPFESLEAVIVATADAISATRPGARMEAGDQYVKRINKIEEIAMMFDGVERAYAISAGREVRVIVKPEKVTEETAPVLVQEIAKKITQQVEFPGQLKVILIREQRWAETA